MVIEAYTSFQKMINSTKQPVNAGRPITCHLKDNCSVINPIFLLTGYNLADNYIKWGSRYYFIDDIVIVGNGLAEYHCSTDVLATYKTDIGNSSQYVLRSASTFNGSITDAFYPMTSLKNTSKDSQANGFIFPASGTYVFGIQGKNTGSNAFGSTTYYCMDVYNASDLMNEIFNAASTEYDAASVEAASGLPEKVYTSIINPQQYIVSCMFLPFEYETVGSTSTSDIQLGWYNFSGEALIFNPSYDALPTIEHTFNNLSKHPQNSRGSYMNNAPFSEYVLSYMPFGEIALPADLLVNATQIHTKLIVDVITGQGTLKIYAGSDASGQLLESKSAQIGVPIAISGGIYDTSVGSSISNAVKGSFIGSAIAGLKGLNPFSEVKETVAQSEQSPTLSTSGSNGALDYLEYDVILYSRFTQVVNDDNTQHGRPLCEVKTINTLSGYIACLQPDLDSVGTRTEKEAIMNFMSGGFYYE